MELKDAEDFGRLADRDGLISIVGFGSLLSRKAGIEVSSMIKSRMLYFHHMICIALIPFSWSTGLRDLRKPEVFDPCCQ